MSPRAPRCGVTNEEFCDGCLPGENVYGCTVPSSNDRVCAIDDLTAVGLCPPGSNAKLLAVCNNGGQAGTGSQQADEGKAEDGPRPGVDESAGAGNEPGKGR